MTIKVNLTVSAESIRRHGPSIIISFYRLGVDPEEAVSFYEGDKAHLKLA